MSYTGYAPRSWWATTREGHYLLRAYGPDRVVCVAEGPARFNGRLTPREQDALGLGREDEFVYVRQENGDIHAYRAGKLRDAGIDPETVPGRVRPNDSETHPEWCYQQVGEPRNEAPRTRWRYEDR